MLQIETILEFFSVLSLRRLSEEDGLFVDNEENLLNDRSLKFLQRFAPDWIKRAFVEDVLLADFFSTGILFIRTLIQSLINLLDSEAPFRECTGGFVPQKQ